MLNINVGAVILFWIRQFAWQTLTEVEHFDMILHRY